MPQIYSKEVSKTGRQHVHGPLNLNSFNLISFLISGCHLYHLSDFLKLSHPKFST